jgi:hypothetical protein
METTGAFVSVIALSPRDRAGFVIPAKAGIHEHGRIRSCEGGVHGFRVKPGMTGKKQ